MGWFSKDDHEAAHNAGQADGSKAGETGKSEYTGMLFSGRSYDEQHELQPGVPITARARPKYK